ncbi:MAG: ComF family protein [Anaerolineae bacterium]
MRSLPYLAQQIKTGLLDLLFPPRCVGCRAAGEWLCPRCRAQIEFIRPPICSRCGRPTHRARLCALCRRNPIPLDGIRAVAYLEGVLREAIHRFKYENLQELALPLGQMLAQYLARHPLPAEVIVPVPLHSSRLAERGYNQSALLARRLAQKSDLPVVENSLQRVKKTVPQIHLNAQERRENVRHAFLCVDERLRGKQVLLIDDVCTTGATLEACTIALRRRGASSVWGLVLARGR